MLVRVIDLIVAVAGVATPSATMSSSGTCVRFYMPFCKAPAGRPSRRDHDRRPKTWNTESPRTRSTTTFSLVQPIPFLPSFRLLSSLLFIADMQARGNGASKKKPTVLIQRNCDSKTVSIALRFTPFLSLLSLHVCTNLCHEKFRPCYEGIFERKQLNQSQSPLRLA